MDTNTLWPPVPELKRKAPVTILREQGLALGHMTANIIYGRPRSVQNNPNYDGVNALAESLGVNTPSFIYAFELQSPSLDYSYPLFVIAHGVELYPVSFRFLDNDIIQELGKTDDQILAKSEEEFLGLLKSIFHSQKTRGIIEAVLAQTATP
jgi:hypothetical protein